MRLGTDELERLRIPFRLYRAPLDSIGTYAGPARCEIEGVSKPHCCNFGIGSSLIVPCPRCRRPAALDVHDAKAAPCPECAEPIPFPVQKAGERLVACYDCLRDGRAVYAHDTEFGMVGWEQAVAGRTHGAPGLTRHQLGNNTFKVAPPADDDEPDWRGVLVPERLLTELIRTPAGVSWQGERWLFHCNDVMQHVGEWSQEEFEAARPGAGRQLFLEATADDPELIELWDHLGNGSVVCYAHQCGACGTVRATVDMD